MRFAVLFSFFNRDNPVTMAWHFHLPDSGAPFEQFPGRGALSTGPDASLR